MKFWAFLAGIAAVGALATPVAALEPNETFGISTVLPTGTSIVTDTLVAGQVSIPDTFLGIFGSGGQITQTNDNGSTAGNGKASGLQNVPIPATTTFVGFAVTGVGDVSFTGFHNQSGAYDVVVQVFSSTGTSLATITNNGTLMPGQVNEFFIPGTAAWAGGRYHVNIDNLVNTPIGGDIDFFTFQGLTPGARFAAQTYGDATSTLKTLMYWYNSAGEVLRTDANMGMKGMGQFSLISDVVPADGKLTFAVTGFGDFVNGMPAGEHAEGGPYMLRLTMLDGLSADFDGNNVVDVADLAVWKAAYRLTSAADADGDADTDNNDFILWQRQLGASSAAAAVQSIPEPQAATLLLVASMGLRRLARRAGAR